jgi:hypothetical protein
VIVDRDVQIAPSHAAVAVDAVLVDALTDLPEAPESLDGDVQELARTLALIAWSHDPLGSRQA